MKFNEKVKVKHHVGWKKFPVSKNPYILCIELVDDAYDVIKTSL